MATIFLRDDGDLTLIVGEEKQRYVVCRRTISGVCKSWHTMFTKFSEASAAEVELPDDNPKAILTILQIAHLRFDQLPAGELSLDVLNQLAIVCDKYDAVATVRPFLTTWLQPSSTMYLSPGNERMIWVAWVFGYQKMFSDIALKLQSTIYTTEDGKCMSVEGTVLDEHMPPKLIERMLEIRQTGIDDLLAVCYAYIDQVEKEETCRERHSKMKEQCHLLTLGSIVHAFRALEIWKPRRTGADIHQSVSSFYKAVKHVKTSTIQETITQASYGHYSPRSQAGHGECNLTSKMVVDLLKVYNAVPTPVENFQLERIQQQAKKGVPLSSKKD
ncbi:hypothetical protein FKW77_001419 [Venturia effusa]|uniref:BTB domain-containing protein n=1 Tax=Venturia effusa TaxID=50376 RepID=A0A517LBX4_9PEZI|nr:hypothetical protein FKW77_001419 [Venturia effusa]